MRAAPSSAGPGEPEPWPSDSAGPGWAARWDDGATGDDAAPGADAAADDDALADAPADAPADGPAASGTRLLLAVSDAQLGDWIGAIAQRQDERALAALYDASLGRVWGLVHRIVRSSALAEEVVEDTYFQVWRQAPRFDPARGSAITWLLGMARSRAIDTLRREARHQHDALDDGGLQGSADAQAPASDALLDAARHHAALHQALLALGPQPRQLVALAFFRGLSHDEIADQTCLPLGTVKSQIRRALLQLRSLLGDQGLPLPA